MQKGNGPYLPQRSARRLGGSTARALGAAAMMVVAFGGATPTFAGEAESRTLFAEGRRMRESGHCADAIVVFRKAYDTFPDGLGALRNVAECEQEVGMFASARRDWADLRLAVLKSTSPKYVGWDKDAEDGQAALSGRVARLTLKLTGAPAVRIQLNGQPFDPRLVDVELEEDDGPVKVEVFYGARKPVVRATELKEGQHETIEIDVPQPPPPDKITEGGSGRGPDGGGHAQEPASGSGKAMRIAGGVSLAVGGLGAIGTVATLVIRQTALSSVDSVCPKHTGCPSSVSGDVSRGKTASTLVNVFAVTAGVGVGLGLTLVLAAPKDPPKTAALAPSVASIGLSPTWGGGVFSLHGGF